MPRSRERRYLRWAALAAAAVLATAMAGCGTSSAGGKAASGRYNTSIKYVAPPPVSSQALQATLDKAFLGPVSASSLNPEVVRSLRWAAAGLTAAQQKLLNTCMQATSCTTGHGTVTIAFADSNGQNPWRKAFRYEGTAQAIAYPQVKKIIYLDANGSLQTFLSNFRSLIAQRVNVIEGAFDFASSMLPLIRQAEAAGIVVVPVTEPVPGASAPSQVLTTIEPSICQNWTALANLMVKKLGKNGTAAVYTGPAGNPYAAVWQPCVNKVLAANGWKVAVQGNTNWTPQGSQQAGQALIASGKKVDAIIYDYTPEDLISPYLKAGKTPPATFVGSTGDFGYLQVYRQAQQEGHSFMAYVPQGAVWELRTGVTAAMDALAGQHVPTQIVVPEPAFPLSSLMKYYSPAAPVGTTILPLVPLTSLRSVLG